MASLKTFLPTLSDFIGVTPAALYTRQRALVGLGLLSFNEGRGPGSGSPLTGENLAALLIALMTSDSLQETDQRVKAMCRAAPRDGGVCPWTGATTLQQAFGRILEDPSFMKSFAFFSVYRGRGAQLGYGRPDESLGSVFNLKRPAKAFGITVAARMDAALYRHIFAVFHAERTIDL